MAEVQNNAWPDDSFWQEDGYQHEQLPIYSYPARDVRTSSAAAPPYQYGGGVSGFASSQSFSNTPRYISDHTPAQRPRLQGYENEQLYTMASTHHTYRERSSSGTSCNYSQARSATNSPAFAHYQLATGTHNVATFLSQGGSFGNSLAPHNGSAFSAIEYKEEEPHQNKDRAQRTEDGGSVNKTDNPKERLPCPHVECRGDDGKPKRFFSRKADVNRHIKSQHDVTRQDCPWPKCTRKGTQGFARLDHLTEHRRGYHSEDIPKRNSGNNSERQDETTPMSNAESGAVAQPSAGSVSVQASTSVSSSYHSTPTTSMAELSDGILIQPETYYTEKDNAIGSRKAVRKHKASHDRLDVDEDPTGAPAASADSSKRRKRARRPASAQMMESMSSWELELLSAEAERRPYYQAPPPPPPQNTYPRQEYRLFMQGPDESMMCRPQIHAQAQTRDHGQAENSTTSASLYLPSHCDIQAYTAAPQMQQYFRGRSQSMQSRFG
ncbi:hypothetical protein PV08_10713 [Exophiala spinifera]|uniref:C2H2-type domain-containing protein n=1 Tax=Exophiala spinifera TaxID=91928 RepID=A0A0D2AXH8_9EURO|nr:uncharacterized protein PV08_10713 [Exophiala spinifera]KIW11413.1 hypothetical protein PV08_10713 [Exophiala spinifera]